MPKLTLVIGAQADNANQPLNYSSPSGVTQFNPRRIVNRANQRFWHFDAGSVSQFWYIHY
jgi:hypothetical protein